MPVGRENTIRKYFHVFFPLKTTISAVLLAAMVRENHDILGDKIYFRRG
jgi:hypothetical protein